MKTQLSVLSFLLLMLFSAQVSFANEPAEVLARKAISDQVAESAPAIEELRTLGPGGLQTMMVQYADVINNHVAHPSLAADEQWQRITAALDAVAQQKNSYISGLYWYTDLETAKKASAANGKPILSLRLLGKLTDELSCANSRFFRTVLYSNAEISAYLKNNFVLHWQSERPVPTVTIDYGDGRKLERTLTGNSIHYILDSQARVIDALPGLYGPRAFSHWLCNAVEIFDQIAGKAEHTKEALLLGFYLRRHQAIVNDWTAGITKIGGKVPQGFARENGSNSALNVAERAATKALTEVSILRAISPAEEALGKITDAEAWKKLAELHANVATLDERSISLIKRQNPKLSAKDLARLLKKFQEVIALDTVRNEYLMHTKLYSWLMSEARRYDLNILNDRVYAELFLTPQSDPWLGLYSTDLYTALDNGGVVRP